MTLCPPLGLGALIGAITDVALGLPGTMTNIEAEAGQRAYSQDFERQGSPGEQAPWPGPIPEPQRR